MRIFIAAGEVSGDIAGAGLARAIADRASDVTLFGIGGERMASAGVTIDTSTNHLGTVGVSEAVAVIPSLWRAFRRVRRRISEAPPDAAVLIGNDVFSVVLGRWLRAHGVPTASYFPPQIWIWGAIAGFISRSYDAILTCFPQEHAVYQRAASRTGTAVVFVGHYLADQLATRRPDEIVAARRALGLDGGGPIVCLMPGSRRHEVRLLAPTLLAAARGLAHRDGDLRFAVAVAEPEFRPYLAGEVDRLRLTERVVMCDGGLEPLQASDVAVMASGTASLEAALLGVPTVAVYKVSSLTQLAVRTAIRLGLMDGETVALPNLVLGGTVVPELKQDAVDAATVARAAREILDDSGRRSEMCRRLAEVSWHLRGTGSFGHAADAVLALARGHAILPRAEQVWPTARGEAVRSPSRT